MMRPLTVRQMSIRQLSRHQIFGQPEEADYTSFATSHWNSYNGSSSLWAEAVAHAFLLRFPNATEPFQGMRTRFQAIAESTLASIAFDRICRKEYNRWASPFVDEIMDETRTQVASQIILDGGASNQDDMYIDRDDEEIKEEAAVRIADHIAKCLTKRAGYSLRNETVMEKNRMDVLFWMNRVGLL